MKKIIAIAAVAATVGSVSAQNKIVIDGSTTVGPIAKAFAEYFMAAHPEVNVTVSESGSGNGAKGLINSTCDIGDMSRPMKEGEFKACADKGVQPVAHVVALDGLPILVHPSNPVKELTIEQVRKNLSRRNHQLERSRRSRPPGRYHFPRHQQRHLRNLRKNGYEQKEDP